MFGRKRIVWAGLPACASLFLCIGAYGQQQPAPTLGATASGQAEQVLVTGFLEQDLPQRLS